MTVVVVVGCLLFVVVVVVVVVVKCFLFCPGPGTGTCPKKSSNKLQMCLGNQAVHTDGFCAQHSLPARCQKTPTVSPPPPTRNYACH